MIKKIMMAMVAFLAVALPIIATTPAMAVTCPAGTPRANESVKALADCSIPNEHKNDNLMKTVQQIINVVLGVLGIVTVAVIVIGGFNYITSSGDPAKVAKAKNTILYGVIGLIIALLAYAIVNFVLTGVFG